MNRLRLILLVVLFGLSSGVAHGHGGIVRFREVEGPFLVTVFTPSELVADAPAEITVMVQRNDSGDAILDADVNLTFTSPTPSVGEPVEQICGQPDAASHGPQFTVPATRQNALNKLLYSAPVQFDAVGNWRLQAFVESGFDRAKIACDIPVGSSRSRLAGLLPYLLLPPFFVALFVVNEGLRRR